MRWAIFSKIAPRQNRYLLIIVFCLPLVSKCMLLAMSTIARMAGRGW